MRPVAVMRMEQRGEHDQKILAVPADGPHDDNVRTIDDVLPQQREGIEIFFKTYHLPHEGETHVHGWDGADAAWRLIEQSLVGLQEDDELFIA